MADDLKPFSANKEGAFIELNLGRGGVLQCIPASIANPYGYTAPFVTEDGTPINDGRGTAAPSDSETTSVNIRLVKGETGTVSLASALRGKKGEPETLSGPLKWPALPPENVLSIKNYAPYISAVDDIFKEWIDPSPDRASPRVVSCTSSVVTVNGRDQNFSHPNPVFACFMKNPDAGISGEPDEFLVAVSYDYPNIKFWSKRTGLWVEKSNLSVYTLNPDFDLTTYAPSDLPSMDEVKWIRKGDRNASGTVMSLWVRNADWGEWWNHGWQPGTSQSFKAGYLKWAWVIDYTAEGVYTVTDAQTETVSSSKPSEGASSGESVVSVSGFRQIDFDYEGDVKVFTTLEFSGSQNYFSASEVVPADEFGNVFTTHDATYTANRKTYLKKGDFQIEIESATGTADDHEGLDTSYTHFSTSMTLAQLLWFGKDVFILYSHTADKNAAIEGGVSSGSTFHTLKLDMYVRGVKQELIVPYSWTIPFTDSYGIGGFSLDANYTGPAVGNYQGMLFNQFFYSTFGVPNPRMPLYTCPWNFRVWGDFYFMSNSKMEFATTWAAGDFVFPATFTGDAYLKVKNEYEVRTSLPEVETALNLEGATSVAKFLHFV